MKKIKSNNIVAIIMDVPIQDPFFVTPDGGKRYQVFTETITIKVPAERTNGSYSVFEIVSPPGGGAPPHIHDREDEMFYVLEGKFEFKCGESVFKAEKGALVTLPRKIPHDFRNIGNTPGKNLVILVPGGFEKAFEEISRLPPGPPDIEKVNSITNKYGVNFLPLPPPS